MNLIEQGALIAPRDAHLAERTRRTLIGSAKEPGAVRIAVNDPYPAFRRGIELALSEAGYVVERPADIGRWAEGPGARALVVSCSNGDDARSVARLRARGRETVAVAVLGDGSPNGYRAALETGVDSAVARDAPLERIVDVVGAAVNHRTVLPTEVARGLATGDQARPHLDDHQARWLRALARGDTVEQLADSAGYSERAMYRQLRRLYDVLGAGNRTEALLQALRRGWID
jgi:DNA-binding NarL/FixJ family response regulator